MSKSAMDVGPSSRRGRPAPAAPAPTPKPQPPAAPDRRRPSRSTSISNAAAVNRPIKRPAGLTLPLAAAVIKEWNSHMPDPSSASLGRPGPRGRAGLRPGEWLVLLFSIAVLGTATWRALTTGANEFLFYIAVLVVIMAVVAVIHRRVELSLLSLWLLALWGVAHLAGGMVPLPEPTGVLYNYWLIPERLKYDQVVHAYGFGVTTLVCWQCLRYTLARAGRGGAPAPTAGPLLLCALAAMGLGALNEVVEFTATRLVANTNVGGYENNAWDLVFNMTGAIIAAVLIRLLGRPGEAPTPH